MNVKLSAIEQFIPVVMFIIVMVLTLESVENTSRCDNLDTNSFL